MPLTRHTPGSSAYGLRPYGLTIFMHHASQSAHNTQVFSMLNKLSRILSIALALSMFSACQSEEQEDNNGTPSAPINLYGELDPDLKAALPLNAVTSLNDIGLWPSDLAIFGDYAYVVDSGNNAITRIGLNDLKVEKNYVDFGENASPYAIYANSEAIYVALQGNGTIARVAHDNPSEITTIANGLIAPTAVCANQGDTYIADSEYDYANPQNTKGSIHLKTTQGEATLPSTSPNPAFIETISLNGKPYLLSINAGVIDFITQTPPPKSCIDLWPLSDISTLAQPENSVCATNASLGRITVLNDTLYTGDAMTPTLYAVPTSKLLEPDATFDTQMLLDTPKGTLTPIAIDNKALAVIDFTSDTITWLKDNRPLRFYLTAPAENPVKGPIDIVYDSPRNQILILNSLSETIDVLKVK